jgi:tetratricopeptide (TPR) repeat protein
MRTHPPDFRLRDLLLTSNDRLDPIQEHVTGCARCRRRLETLRKRTATSAYDAALTINARRLQEMQAAYAKEREAAAGLVAELLKHPAERQRVLIRNHPRFQTWGVFERLLASSNEEVTRHPQWSEEMARLALNLSEHLDASHYGAESIEDLRARAWAYIGNAHRVRFELQEAHAALDRALVHLRRGTREPWELAIWLDLKASLLRAQRRFDEAMRLLNRALVLFLAVGDRHRAGRTLISMENVLQRAGQPEKGIPLLYQALELIDPAQEPRVLLIVKHNLIDDLTEVGRYMEAQGLLAQARSLYRNFDEPWIRYRRCWIEGKIARGLEQPEKAEELLLSARAGFQEQNAAYEISLVSLELAGLYAEQGRTAEMKQLAEEMVPIFSSRQIHREALAALALWCQAVQTETAGAELAAQVATAIKRGHYDHPVSEQDTL